MIIAQTKTDLSQYLIILVGVKFGDVKRREIDSHYFVKHIQRIKVVKDGRVSTGDNIAIGKGQSPYIERSEITIERGFKWEDWFTFLG